MPSLQLVNVKFLNTKVSKYILVFNVIKTASLRFNKDIYKHPNLLKGIRMSNKNEFTV